MVLAVPLGAVVKILIRRTLKALQPHARELGTMEELGGVEQILTRGNSADRQLQVFNANRDIVEAVSYTHLRAHETVLDLVCRLLL